MSTLIGNIVRAATRKPNSKLNILTFPTHERYEVGLCKTGHNFYAWRGQNIKDWNSTYAAKPGNYCLLNPSLGDGQIPVDLDLDLVLSQNKFGQFPIAQRIARMLHLPLLSLEHTLPTPDMGMQLELFKRMRGDTNVFISEYSRKAWGWTEGEASVIHHGIDIELFSPAELPKQTHVLSVVNDFANRDWCCGFNLWREVTNGLPVKLLGNSPGLSKPASSIQELIDSYRTAKVFLNTSLISPVPTVLLEAMACGCAVVSTATCMIPDIIKDGENGLLGQTADELRDKVTLLLEDSELAARLGDKARETIINYYNQTDFVKEWDKVLQVTASKIFTGEIYEG
jgi:hypothetical protein